MDDDFKLTITEDDQVQYWTEDPDYPVMEWQREVAEGNTRMGYWDWVNSCKEADDET